MSHSSADPHSRSKRSDDDEDEDTPAERSLRKAGCLEHHYRVQECMFEKKDWRMCKDEVKAFRECVEGSKKKAE